MDHLAANDKAGSELQTAECDRGVTNWALKKLCVGAITYELMKGQNLLTSPLHVPGNCHHRKNCLCGKNPKLCIFAWSSCLPVASWMVVLTHPRRHACRGDSDLGAAAAEEAGHDGTYLPRRNESITASACSGCSSMIQWPDSVITALLTLA